MGDDDGDGSGFYAAHGETLPDGWHEIDLKEWADEDRKAAATNANVDRAIRALKAGTTVLSREIFGAVVKFMFDGFPKQRRLALKTGRLVLGDGRTVTREVEPKAEAA